MVVILLRWRTATRKRYHPRAYTLTCAGAPRAAPEHASCFHLKIHHITLALQEWNDDWRLPREYFQDEGSLPKERRIEILRGSGHRRASIDLASHEAMFLLASRRKHSRSKVSKFIVEGFDAEEIFQLDKEVDAAEIISTWASRWLREAQQAKRQKNSSVINGKSPCLSVSPDFGDPFALIFSPLAPPFPFCLTTSQPHCASAVALTAAIRAPATGGSAMRMAPKS